MIVPSTSVPATIFSIWRPPKRRRGGSPSSRISVVLVGTNRSCQRKIGHAGFDRHSAASRGSPEPAQLAIECLARDPKAAGRGGLRGQGLESLADQRQLDAGQQRRQRRGVGQGGRLPDRGCEVMWPDPLSDRDGKDEPVHLVLELADVARPRV